MKHYQVKIDNVELPDLYTLDELLANGLLDDYDGNILVKLESETEWRIARDYPYSEQETPHQEVAINDVGSNTLQNTMNPNMQNGTYSINDDGTINRPDNYRRPQKPDSNLVWAIISITLCLPLGILALMEAVKVDSLYSEGNVNGAIQASENAKKWSLWSIYFWIIVFALIIIAAIVSN